MIRAIIGAQYGDEGKGKLVDYLAAEADFAVRFNGSGNAGHCVEKEDGTRYAVHLLPAAIFGRGITCCTGAGMVINPLTLLEEIEYVNRVSSNPIWIDPRAHVVTPFHIVRDKESEIALGDNKIMTTLTGNGPAYADKMSRKGLRLEDLQMSPDGIETELRKLDSREQEVNESDPHLYRAVASELHVLGEKLSPYFQDNAVRLNDAIKAGMSVLFAGAHGTFLDIDHGNYPFVTSSTCTVGGIGTTGVSPTHLNEVVGVVKAYTTRSGAGPLSDMEPALASYIREKANEYGTTTKRPRRIGWIDLSMIRYASMLNHFTYIAVTMLDILSGLKSIRLVDTDETKVIKGWEEDISRVKIYANLPEEAQRFIHLIEEAAGVPARLISVGPKKTQTIHKRAR